MQGIYSALFPDGWALRWNEIKRDGSRIVLSVESARPAAQCPKCGGNSSRVHSYYQRTLSDLPWHGEQVVIHWRSRRFFCDASTCSQKIFSERLPAVAAAHARKTGRLRDTLRGMALNCGGESGARLSKQLGMPASADTLLRLIRRKPLPSASAPRVLGVDDWAFRRGQRYGTILCDLERRRVIDLLPERSSESFAAWLLAHPGVEVISRDRGDYYIKGATAGAPSAVQVADRWHLHANLREAIARIAERHPHQLLAAARTIAARPSTASDGKTETLLAESGPKPLTRSEEARQRRQTRRRELYERVIELHRQNISLREIGRQLDLHRSTVTRFAQAEGFPERATRRYGRKTDRFIEHLQKRWQEGCRSARQLTEELRQQGYKGFYDTVKRRVAAWRRSAADATNSPSKPPPPQRLSSNQVSWLMIKPESDLSDDDRQWNQAIEEHCPTLKRASELAKKFTAILREKRHTDLDAWIDEATGTDVAENLRRFAKGLRADLNAIRAAIELPWSNGQTEGQVNRLKMIKRQMFGRANFDLLRHRVLETVA